MNLTTRLSNVEHVSVWLAALLLGASMGCSAQALQAPGDSPPVTLSVHSSLVLVPALVKTRKGELVHSLSADDFTLKDDGVVQRLRLEPDTDMQPLALVVLVQTGGVAGTHLQNYHNLGAVLDALVGAVQHQVAVVSFDGHQHVEQPFTADVDKAAAALDSLDPGDKNAAILDSLRFCAGFLGREPPSYRRAILLLSETMDSGSQTSLEAALRAIEDTNTSIYSFAFPTTRTALHHEGAKLPLPFKATEYSSKPYPAGGCMSRDPDADPDARGDRRMQALDCADDLLPPLRLARMALLAAKDGLRRNVPETIARLTGGEYFSFKDARSPARNLVTISNDVPNHYVLSFAPQSPHPGPHSLQLQLKTRPDLELEARTAYWIDAENN